MNQAPTSNSFELTQMLRTKVDIESRMGFGISRPTIKKLIKNQFPTPTIAILTKIHNAHIKVKNLNSSKESHLDANTEERFDKIFKKLEKFINSCRIRSLFSKKTTNLLENECFKFLKIHLSNDLNCRKHKDKTILLSTIMFAILKTNLDPKKIRSHLINMRLIKNKKSFQFLQLKFKEFANI